MTRLAVLRGLAANEALDLAVLEPLLVSDDPQVLEALATRSDLTPAAAGALARRGMAPALARNPAAAVPVWGVLAGDPDPEVRRLLAHAPGLVEAAQRVLMVDPEAGVRRALAFHRDLAPDVARQLAGDVVEVRRALTSYGWALPADVVRTLLADPDGEVRAGAVRAGPPPDLVAGLLADPATRAAAAEHAVLTPAQVTALIGEAGVHEALVRNERVPVEALLGLADDPDAEVRAALMVRAGVPDDVRAALVASVEPQTYHLAAWLLEQPLDVRVAHVRSPFVFCRRAVAFSADLPGWAVAVLAADENHSVRLLLAEHHPGIPGAMLPDLVGGPGHAPWELVRHPAMPAAALAGFARSADERLRWIAATGPNLPAGVAAELAEHPDRQTRIHVAANPALPEPVLVGLLEDADDEIARAAARNPALPRSAIRLCREGRIQPDFPLINE